MRSIVRLGNSGPSISVKKGLALLFVCALLLAGTAVAGCASSTNQTGSSSGNGGASGISDSGGMKITVTGKGETQQIGSNFTADKGYKFVWYNVTLTDLKEKNYLFTPTNLDLITSDGQSYPDHYSILSPAINGLKSVSQVNPGDTISGTVPFMIPQGATPAKLEYQDVNNKATVNV